MQPEIETKVCADCKRELPITEFTPLTKDKIRRHCYCYACMSAYLREYYKKKHVFRAKKIAYATALVYKHYDKTIARRIANAALKQGILTKPEKCQCCKLEKKQIEMHHPDYKKPLSVIWLCASCHRHYHTGTTERSESIRKKVNKIIRRKG